MGKKLDKKAHARALRLHYERLETDAEYREAWKRLIASLFTDLASARSSTDDVDR